MNILNSYKKELKNPLKSTTIKLHQEQFDALRKYNINLGLMIRSILDDSDLMQTYRQEQQINSDDIVVNAKKVPSEEGFREDLFKFKYKGIRFYYLNPKTMFEKSSNGEVIQIKKGRYYGAKNKHDKESSNV